MVWDAVLEAFSKQAEDTRPKWNHLVVHKIWSSYLCSQSIWEDMSILDLLESVLRCVLVNTVMPDLCGVEHRHKY